MSNTSASFHAITSVSVKYEELPPGGCLNFTFRGADGSFHNITAHVEKPIAIDGAEFLNFVASHEKQPAPEKA